MLTDNIRHNRWLFSAALVGNTALVLSSPTEGNHYFIDLVAGAIAATATIGPCAPVGDVFDTARLNGVRAAPAGGAVRGIAGAVSPASQEGRAPRTRAPTSGTPPRSAASGGAPLPA